MKDKRQRMSIAWPYAAVYTDPTFAASLLHAAASSLPLHYPPPPVYPTHYPPRYHPWTQGFNLPQTGLQIPNSPITLNQPMQSLHQSMMPNFNQTGFEFHNYPRTSPTVSPVRSEVSLSPVPDISVTQTSPKRTITAERPKLFQPYKSE